MLAINAEILTFEGALTKVLVASNTCNAILCSGGPSVNCYVNSNLNQVAVVTGGASWSAADVGTNRV